MKALAFMLLGFGLLFTACSDDDSSGAKGNGGSANVRISLYASDALSVRSTYNSSSNLGGATNLVNTTDYYFRYILAVYDANGSEVVKEQQVVNVGTGATTFEVTLTSGEEYTAVGWCDFVTGSGDDAADYHYDTTGFPEISCKDIAINDETYDAYFASQSFTALSEATESITLKRPFAKLRLVATNRTTNNAPDAISITYSGLTRYTTFNAKDGSVSNASSTATYSATTIPTYNNESEGTTILVDYILVGSEAQTVSISYNATQNGTSVGSKSVADVPLQRNYLTTASGKVLNGSDDDGTVNESEGIIVNGAWDGNYEVVIEGTDEDETDGDETDGDETDEEGTDDIEPYNDVTVTANSTWTLGQDDAGYTIEQDASGEYYVAVTLNTSGRGDIKIASSDDPVVLDPAEAPILCFRVTDVNDDGYSRNITIDTSGNLVSDGTKYSGGLGGNNNKWETKYYCKDGTDLLVYNLATQTLTNGSTSTSEVLPSACSFTTFQIKYADVKLDGSAVQVSYKFYWFKSFASMEDMATYLEEIGLAYQE